MPFTTLGQETRWAYSTTRASPHDVFCSQSAASLSTSRRHWKLRHLRACLEDISHHLPQLSRQLSRMNVNNRLTKQQTLKLPCNNNDGHLEVGLVNALFQLVLKDIVGFTSQESNTLQHRCSRSPFRPHLRHSVDRRRDEHQWKCATIFAEPRTDFSTVRL